MSDLKKRIRKILDEYKTANMYSESVRDRIATELYDKLGDDDTHQRNRRHGWDDE
jgi:regulator of replication initiation timing